MAKRRHFRILSATSIRTSWPRCNGAGARSLPTFAGTANHLDPQAETTFVQARLDHTLRHVEPHRTLYAFYTALLRLRTTLPALAQLSKDHMDVLVDDHAQVLLVRRWCPTQESLLLLHFGPTPRRVTLPWPPGAWRKRLDSMEVQWQGEGSMAARAPPLAWGGGVVGGPCWALFIRQEEEGA